MSWLQLQQRLYPRLQQTQQNSQGKLLVTVIRATNLRLPGIHWLPPQAVVALGNHEQRSPLGEAFGPHPIFDWRVELPFTGHESHLVFQVICEGQLMGSCVLPLRDVLSASSGFNRALPLREATGEGDERSELFVRVTREGDLEIPPAQEQSAERLRMKTSQVRVTLRSLRMEENLAIDKGSNKICAYVVAACGQQTARTKAAFLTAGQNDRNKFVFNGLPNSNFDCGDLLRGKLDKYRSVPTLEERRTTDPQHGYHMRIENGLQVTYSNVQFTFWYQQQDLLELMVYDDLFMYYPDNLVATGAVQLNEAFRRAFTQDGRLLDEDGKQPKVRMHVNLAPSLASLRPSGTLTTATSVDDGGTGSTAGSKIGGEIELEIEFMEEPIACPTALENTFRQSLAQTKKAEELQRRSLQFLAEIGRDTRPSGLPVLEDLFAEQRENLAILCCTCAVVAARRVVGHEERVVAVYANRLEDIVQEICEVLLETGTATGTVTELQLDLLTCARRAVGYKTVEEAADRYRQSCRSTQQMEHLLPLGTLLCLLRPCYGALLRSSLQRAAEAIEPGATIFLELLERYLVAMGELQVSDPLTLQLGTDQAEIRELADTEFTPGVEQQDQLRLGRAAVYANFLPDIDGNRLLDAEMKELEKDTLPGQYPYIVPGSLCIGGICGALMAFSVVETAEIVHTLDTRVFCHKDNQHMAIMRASCWLMQDSYLDSFMEWVAESPAWFKGIFLIAGFMDGKTAFTNMRRRVLKMQELRLEAIGPSLSPHKVVCISGFLRSLADVCQPWVVDPDKPWTSGQVYFLRFETAVLYSLGLQLSDLLARDLKRSESVARFLLSCTNLISFSQGLISTLLDELGDLIDRASARAQQVGKLLARQLVEAHSNARRQAPFTVSLMGYSTGGVVVQSCLRELQEMVTDGNPVARDIVCDAVMLGTPALALNEDWSKLRQLVSGRFINGFFAQDSFLMSYQFRRGGAPMAGYSPLRAPDVENVPMDSFITTHNEYAEQMPLILQRVFQGTV